MYTSFLSFLSKLNRNRIYKRKLRKVDSELASACSNCTKIFPERIDKVLIIDPLFCFGDALYVNGLLKYLVDSGLDVSIVTFSRLKDIYCSTVDFCSIYDIESSSEIEEVLSGQWDVVVDLCYMFNQRWKVRKEIVEKLKSYSFVCDKSIGNSLYRGVYSECLDMSTSRHVGERMARIASRLLGHAVDKIRPYVGVEKNKEEIGSRYVYVNTVGGTVFRTLSKSQISRIAEEFNKRRQCGYFYCDKDFSLEETLYVRKITPENFKACLSVIADAVGVISPDTSVVHAASAFNKPLLAFYCENDPEHYGLPMSDIWAPVCSNSVILKPSRRGVHRVSVSEIDDEQLSSGLKTFFQFLENA